jgi:DMSO/TMAO reductase YedYZ molybdopterin-dependent catalytic subunit
VRSIWPRAVAVSGPATPAALAVMYWLRAAFQVRTLPERLLEWILLFVPLSVSERGLQRFGAEAKVLAVYTCDAIGTARWTGVRLSDLLTLTGGLTPGVKTLVCVGADEFSSALPPDPDLLHDALLVFEMNGKVLPIEHGYPARMLVPNR